jgi:hypothetical protein
MPATRESLLVQIKDLEESLRLARSQGKDTSLLEEQLDLAHKRFTSSGHSLNESSNLLKG